MKRLWQIANEAQANALRTHEFMLKQANFGGDLLASKGGDSLSGDCDELISPCGANGMVVGTLDCSL